ncbi:DNA replication/repair protein RecF [Oscillibacter valericigenes]|uniref:DNA replication/repair protein RecF n=1 Tax=Oscillibacter ruminantium TaxID=1263547 RepID=UPI0002EA2BE7|nr:DNA replication/repair protein RecF [Oscillibacter ruminantium]MDN0031434.1 DNA replication/repair protein RecF [Oscillibacter valericigenes]
MRIDRLTLEHFRNYNRQDVAFDTDCNVIFGENAQGKTNLLEAIQYLSCGHSSRAKSDRELIGFQAENALIQGQIFARDREFVLRTELYREKRRKLWVNKVPAKTSSELSQVFQTVFFCPEDLLLIREGAAARRKFLDQALCQLRPRYAAALAAYRRVYAHKTRILRDCEEQPGLLDMLPEFNERLIQSGAVIIHYRAQFTEKLAVCAAANHADCSGGKEKLSVNYKTVSTVLNPLEGLPLLTDQLRAHMESHKQAELGSRLCLSGPHKDDLLVEIDGRDAKTYSSQGQTRTAALSLKLAEREIYKNVTGEAPILLLDDVLSELDPRRQEFVLNRISGGQVFITCCEDDRLPVLLGGKVFHIAAGKVLESF